MEVIKAGQQSWPAFQKMLPVVRWLQASSSANYKQVRWFPTDLDPKQAEDWPRFSGDNQVREFMGLWIPRQARLAGIVGVKAAFMDKMRANTPGSNDGVATVSLQGKIWAGMLPEGVNLQRLEYFETTYDTVAGRLGPGPCYLVPARINPETGSIKVPSTDLLVLNNLARESFMPTLPKPFQDVPVV